MHASEPVQPTDLREEDVESPIRTHSNRCANRSRLGREHLCYGYSFVSRLTMSGVLTSDVNTQLIGPKLSEKRILVR